MYPPVRLNGEACGCSNRLSAAEAARCSVKWDELRFTREEFALLAENMRKRMDEFRDGCAVEADEGIGCRAGSSSDDRAGGLSVENGFRRRVGATENRDGQDPYAV